MPTTREDLSNGSPVTGQPQTCREKSSAMSATKESGYCCEVYIPARGPGGQAGQSSDQRADGLYLTAPSTLLVNRG